MTTALVIAGHGSHLTPQTAAPAWQHADAIRALGLFDEVTCAFWKEFPALHRVLDTLSADDITIVPLFTSQGYFSQKVLPAEFGLEGPLTIRNGRTIRYTDTVGQHPLMTAVVSERADAVIQQFGLDPATTALAIAGHGTQRDPGSAAATQQQAQAMRDTGRFAEVVAIYMDESPEIESVYTITRSPSIIVVPFFVADGSHTQEDIPQDLGLSRDPRRQGYAVPSLIDGRAVYYTAAVGMEPSIVQVLIDLVRAADAPLHDPHPLTNAWAGFPTAGLDQLKAIRFPFQFGQIVIDSSEDQFVVHPLDDASRGILLQNPAELRDLLSRDARGRFRALRTATDLPLSWRVVVDDHVSLLAVLETIYPSAWIDFVQNREGRLPIQPLEQMTARQTGIYKQVRQLPDQDLPIVVDALCGQCVRHPTWYHGTSDPDQLPCPEPCQCWMSFALQQVRQERTASIALSEDEIASLQAVVQAAPEFFNSDVRPAEYEDPRNPTRLSALLTRLHSLAHKKDDT